MMSDIVAVGKIHRLTLPNDNLVRDKRFVDLVNNRNRIWLSMNVGLIDDFDHGIGDRVLLLVDDFYIKGMAYIGKDEK